MWWVFCLARSMALSVDIALFEIFLTFWSNGNTTKQSTAHVVPCCQENCWWYGLMLGVVYEIHVKINSVQMKSCSTSV